MKSAPKGKATSRAFANLSPRTNTNDKSPKKVAIDTSTIVEVGAQCRTETRNS